MRLSLVLVSRISASLAVALHDPRTAQTSIARTCEMLLRRVRTSRSESRHSVVLVGSSRHGYKCAMRSRASVINSPTASIGHSMFIISICEHYSYPAASCLARSVARITALISVTRRPPSSSSRMPSMVQPAGVVTSSLSSAG